MSDPALGLLMLGLIVVVIMMGFPTAFTLMGLGMFFGFFAYYRAGESWADNHIFDLMVQRTYGAMTNDVLISIPLFVLMGYVMERGALVDKMFYAIQLAFRRVPAALAVASLIVCTFWGIASGLVGAVVVLMGVIAFNPMLRAGYDVRLASGVITAGGTRNTQLGAGIGEFVDRYIFPGGELLHVSQVLHTMAEQGLEGVDTENLRPHYARTLWAWSDALEANLDEAQQVLQQTANASRAERVLRAYRLYLAGSALSFEQAWVSLHQMLSAKPASTGGFDMPKGAQSAYPFNREYMYSQNLR
mgnify:CR=1 FL=1